MTVAGWLNNQEQTGQIIVCSIAHFLACFKQHVELQQASDS